MMNKNNIKDLFLYLVVGGVATIAEWAVFFVLIRCSLHYAAATAIAYILSTFVNWVMGRLLVFKESKGSVLKEILSIYLVSVVGLLLNVLIMWVAVDLLSLGEGISKIGATGMVFFFNFLVRKLLIYRKEN
jgi:putative flippase GtrA